MHLKNCCSSANRYSHIKFMWQKRAPKEISFAVDYQSNVEQTTATGKKRFPVFCGKRKRGKNLFLLFVYYQREVISFSFNFMLFFAQVAKKNRTPTTTTTT